MHHPTRRDILAAGAGLVAASVLGPAVASPVRSEPMLRKALKYGMIHPGSTVLEKFQIAKACGFEGVELDAPDGPPVEEVLAAKEATGIEVPGVVDRLHWRQTLGDPDPAVRQAGVECLLGAIRDCAAYGGGSVLLVPAVVNERISYEDAYHRSQAEVRRAIPLAEELGVRVSFENVWNQFLLSPLEAARYVDEFESPVVGWHLDIGNVVNYGWPEQWVRTLGPRITRLDVKEFSRSKRDEEGLYRGFQVGIGDGDCGWDRVMPALREIGYAGWATAEVSGGDEAWLTDTAQRMDRVFAK